MFPLLVATKKCIVRDNWRILSTQYPYALALLAATTAPVVCTGKAAAVNLIVVAAGFASGASAGKAAPLGWMMETTENAVLAVMLATRLDAAAGATVIVCAGRSVDIAMTGDEEEDGKKVTVTVFGDSSTDLLIDTVALAIDEDTVEDADGVELALFVLLDGATAMPPSAPLASMNERALRSLVHATN